MDLVEKINSDIKTAMLGKDAVSLRALRAIKAAILISNTSGGASMSEADEVKMLQKLVKQRQDSIDIFKQQNREDLAVSEMGFRWKLRCSPPEINIPCCVCNRIIFTIESLRLFRHTPSGHGKNSLPRRTGRLAQGTEIPVPRKD